MDSESHEAVLVSEAANYGHEAPQWVKMTESVTVGAQLGQMGLGAELIAYT